MKMKMIEGDRLTENDYVDSQAVLCSAKDSEKYYDLPGSQWRWCPTRVDQILHLMHYDQHSLVWC